MNKKEKCEICELEIGYLIELHHIQSRSKGGSSLPFNIANICNGCHKKIHHGLIIVEGKFNSNVGRIIVWRNWNDTSITGEKDPEVWLYPNAEVFKLSKK